MSKPYEKLDRLFVAGEWRDGHGDTLKNKCPWDESVIFSMNAAETSDVDEACRAATEAQREWSGPGGKDARDWRYP